MSDDLLKLLMAMVLADNYVHKNEVDAFTAMVSQLSENLQPEELVTQYEAREWFFQNRADIVNLLDDNDPLVEIEKLARSLSHLSWSFQIYDSLKKIALSDGVEHVSENKFLKMVKSILVG